MSKELQGGEPLDAAPRVWLDDDMRYYLDLAMGRIAASGGKHQAAENGTAEHSGQAQQSAQADPESEPPTVH